MNGVTGSIEEQPFNVPTGSENIDPTGTISVWPLIGTVVVFFLILIAALYVIRYLNRKNVRGINAPWVRILDRQALGNQQVLYLVEIAGQLQVLGVTDHQIVKVSEINDPEIAGEILEEIANRPVSSELLSGWREKKFLRRKKADPFSQELKRLLEEVEK